MLSLFHFLRPWWLLALIPAIMLSYYWYKKSQTTKNSWQQHCDPHLLEHLLVKQTASKNWGLITLLMSGWLVIILALAGPTWSRYAAPIYQKKTSAIFCSLNFTRQERTHLSPPSLTIKPPSIIYFKTREIIK